jgi:THO complex subunit 2
MDVDGAEVIPFDANIKSIHDPLKHSIWLPCLHETILGVYNALPGKVWELISPHFYVTFWQLSLYDIFVPKAQYQIEVSKQKKQIESLESNRGSDIPPSRRKREKDRCNLMIQLLERELKVQEENAVQVKERLILEKDGWIFMNGILLFFYVFVSFSSDFYFIANNSSDPKAFRFSVVDAFLQYCVFPRCLYSVIDAMFAAHFINMLHSIGTPNFATISLYDRVYA